MEVNEKDSLAWVVLTIETGKGETVVGNQESLEVDRFRRGRMEDSKESGKLYEKKLLYIMIEKHKEVTNVRM